VTVDSSPLLLMPSGFLAGRDTLRSHRPASAYMCLGRFQIFSSTGRSPAVRFITVPLIFSLALRIVCVAEGVQATHGRSRRDDGVRVWLVWSSYCRSAREEESNAIRSEGLLRSLAIKRSPVPTAYDVWQDALWVRTARQRCDGCG
jgi:hypothetical protein